MENFQKNGKFKGSFVTGNRLLYKHKLKVMTEIRKTQLFRYFKGQSTGSEKKGIDTWLGESDLHKEQYRDASHEFEYLMMHGDMDTIRGRRPISAGNRAAARRRIPRRPRRRTR